MEVLIIIYNSPFFISFYRIKWVDKLISVSSSTPKKLLLAKKWRKKKLRPIWKFKCAEINKYSSAVSTIQALIFLSHRQIFKKSRKKKFSLFKKNECVELIVSFIFLKNGLFQSMKLHFFYLASFNLDSPVRLIDFEMLF